MNSAESLESDGIPHLLLPIDELGDGTKDTLQQELSYKGDLIEQVAIRSCFRPESNLTV